MSDSVVLGSAGVISSGNDNGWSTVTDGGNQTLYDSGSDTITTTQTITSTRGGVTTSDLASSTETDSTTLSQNGPYQETSTETSNDTLGSNGVPASGSDAPAQWTTSTLTTTETGSSTISTTDHATESYTLGGAVATQWLSSTDTLTGTNGDTGTLTSTENLTGVTSFGSGLSITGGNQSDSLYQTGSDFPSQVSTDTITSTDSLVYAYANSDPTIAQNNASTITNIQTFIEGTGSTLTGTDTTTLTLGSTGLVTSGSLATTLNEPGWSTDTLTGTFTQTDRDSSGVTDETGNATEQQNTASVVTSTVTPSEFDSVTTSTQSLVNNVTLGTSATMSTGSETTTLVWSGNSFFSQFESDSDTGSLTGGTSISMGATQSSTSYSNTYSGSGSGQFGGNGPSGASVTESLTVGSNGLVNAGTLTMGSFANQTWTTATNSETRTTTESQSTSLLDSAAGATDTSLDQTTLTGTITDFMNSTYPSTVSQSGGSTLTMGTSAVVTAGTASTTLYETGSPLTTDVGTGTLTTTETSTLGDSDYGQNDAGTTSTTAVLTDLSTFTLGGLSTLTETETLVLGANATVVSGLQVSFTSPNPWDYFTLYRIANETYQADGNLSDSDSDNMDSSSSYSISAPTTSTITSYDAQATSSVVTLDLGSNASITYGYSSATLYETGNDSTVGSSSGNNVRQFSDTGPVGLSSTYTTTFSSANTITDYFTDTLTNVAALTTSGLIVSGCSISSLTDVGTQTSTYNETGSRTVYDGSNYEEGAYNNTESDTLSNSRFESTSLGLGSNGNIVGGTDTYIYSSFGSHSQSESQTGSQVLADPEGGPSYTAGFESLSIVTTSLSRYTNGTLTLGAMADVTGGSDTFTFLQANIDSHSLVDTGSNENIIDVGSDSYYLTMTGTEILGAGGAVSSGGDWFTWQQGDSDSYTLGR